MVLYVEYRIPLPLEVEEYHIAQLYTVAEESKSNTGNGEGVTVLKNEPYDNERGCGQYTYKTYNIDNKLPGFVRSILPKGCTTFHEHAWNAYPNCLTDYSNEYFEKKFKLTITSKHLADNGCSENAFNLSEEQLKQRKVIVLNIADNAQLESSKYDANTDVTILKSTKTSVLPLAFDFAQNIKPMMCCYKFYEIRCEISLVGGMIERNMVNSILNLLISFHRRLVSSIDQWSGMTMEDLREHEKKTTEELERRIKSTT